MIKRIYAVIMLIALFMGVAPQAMAADDQKKDLDVKEVIFHHLGDGYGWEVPFSHVNRIPLPVIVRAEDGTWHAFSSNRLTEVEVSLDEKTDDKSEHLVAVPYSFTEDGNEYTFVLSHEGAHKNKVVQLIPLDAEQQQQVRMQAEQTAFNDSISPENVTVEGYMLENGLYYREYKPWDISITKNVLALFISAAIVFLLVMILVRHYRKYGFKTPRKGMGFFEMLVDFVYTGVIKSTLKEKAARFAPYLLTCFFFILFMNLLGLVVIFPGGANLTGNIAITLVLAVLTFIMTNIHGNKHYWKEIFWPDVPIWLKCPLPIMQVIEVFGIFTKPAALCVRLFANMMGGHMIVLTLTLLIFIFAAFGAAATGASVVISILFSVFMLVLDVLVSFIQAYVFTMLSTIFIGLAQPSHEHEGHEHNEETSHNEESINGGPVISPAPAQ